MDRQHIFVVNGSPDFLDVVRELLQDESYNVTTTNFVPETYNQIAALNPALLIIDLAFRRRAGWELLEHLHDEALTHGIPIVVISTETDLLERVQGDKERYGGQRFLRKPLDIEDLLGAVEELIGSA